MITSKDIERETQILKKRIDKIEQKYLEIEEEGSLRICRKKKQTDFYFRKNNNEKWIYIPKSEDERVKALAQRDYYERVLKTLKRKYRAFAMLRGQGANEALLGIYDKLHPVRKTLVEPVILSDGEYVEKWKQEGKAAAEIRPDEEGSYYTDNGERVRSKSEIMIANKFLKQKIPYIYEPALVLSGRLIHPDFKVLNLQTRQSFYFEHFGMMDDPDYSAKAVLKIDSYIMNGYLPGQGLLFTMETHEKPLDMRLLDKMIEGFLL